jgi:PAS domain S-box-containing protein
MQADEVPIGDGDSANVGELLRSIAVGTSAATGEAFFRSLAKQLCTALKTDFAGVSELAENNPDSMRVFALFEVDKFWDEVEHEIPNTPCQQTLALGRFSCPSDVQSAFPLDHQLVAMQIEGYLGVRLTGSQGQPLGVISVMSRSPLRNVSAAETILEIFAARASAEIERRRTERALRESDFRNRAIFSALPDLIFVLDLNGVVRDVYPKSSSVFGLETSAGGEKLDTLLGPQAARLILESATSDARQPVVVEFPLPASNNERFYEARTVAFGETRLLTIIRDITDKKQAEAKLAESQRFGQRLGQTSPNVLFVYDLVERRTVYSNDRSVDVIGYTAQEVVDMGDRFIPNLLHPDDIAVLPQLGAEYSKRKDGEVFENVFRMRHKNGEWRWVHRSATVFSRTPDGRPKQIIGAVTDITEYKLAEKKLQELSARLLSIQNEERRRIARELHDVTGQNLAVIGFNLRTLEQSQEFTPAMANILSECQKLCEQSQTEIRTLSYLLHPPMLDPLGLIHTLEWYIEGFRKRTRMKIVLDVSNDFGRLPTELETDLFRVIQEGLTNAIRHSGSEITVIRLARKDNSVLLQIEDRGRGLKTGTKDADRTALGVGIPSMRERLRRHSGTLEIVSQGQGTTLTVTVPATGTAQGGQVVEKGAY